MYQNNKLVTKQRNSSKPNPNLTELDINRLIEEVKQNAPWYENSGLTHISSLLN